MNVYEAIKTRRSTRSYKPDAVEDAQLEKILAAGRAAPCGGNSQTTHFIVIRSCKVLDEIALLVRETFANMEVKPDMYKSLKAVISASKSGNFAFHYNAPVLIVTANKIGYDNAMADCACALENMMLMANALDLGSCWINRAKQEFDSEEGKEILRALGIEGDYEGVGHCIVGYPEGEAPEAKPSSAFCTLSGMSPFMKKTNAEPSIVPNNGMSKPMMIVVVMIAFL